MPATVVWFYNDLRVGDNEALLAACRRGAVIGLYTWTPSELGDRAPGAARRWWLHHALTSLAASLEPLGIPLVLRQAERAEVAVEDVLRETEADAVYWNKRYDPAVSERDRRIAASLRRRGIWVAEYDGWLLHDPASFRTEHGDAYRVFTPFWRRFTRHTPPPPRPRPTGYFRPRWHPNSDDLAAWRLLPHVPWDREFYPTWEPTEQGAERAIEQFVRLKLPAYARKRDFPACEGTSRLSPYLATGQISPRQIWYRVSTAGTEKQFAEPFLRQLAWREFAYHVLESHPNLHEQPLRAEFRHFPWKDIAMSDLRRWQRGHTGIPIIDAGMRQLWRTGWMHNRARMIVASWLTKNLQGDWRIGEQWFWDTLVDADPANNAFGWQWVAGCGADAAPYWRVFQPLRQAKRFDPNGDYVRRWVPELAQLPDQFVHEPWLAPPEVLQRAGVKLDTTYPAPMLDPVESRRAALAAFAAFRRSNGQ
ncbi:MAG: deoxyribodipyrimidine photo-lyase [Candidatus Binatia bacterium]|nr:MAG: deoxyribodipyrimidine photo-lyase [Candidatus Binatia bacterium]